MCSKFLYGCTTFISCKLKFKKNDEVIVPAMTFCSTVNSVIISGAKPVLADVNLSTMNICPEEIKKK